MATEKVSLTLDGKAVREARGRVGGRGLSRYVDRALRLRLQHDRISELLAEFEKEAGPIPSSVMRKVQREWPIVGEGVADRPARRRRKQSD